MCSSVQVYALGSEEEIELAVEVENRGEDAFESTVRIFMPADVDYISVGDIAAPPVSLHSCPVVTFACFVYSTVK